MNIYNLVLQYAIKSRDASTILYVVDNHLIDNIDLYIDGFPMVMHLMFSKQCIEIAEYIITNHNCDLSLKHLADNMGYPIAAAYYDYSGRIMQFLLANDSINMNDCSLHGDTPLTYAISRRNYKVVDLLINSDRVNLGLGGVADTTPLMQAIITHNYSLCYKLIESGRSNPGHVNNYKNTALMYLCNMLYSDTIRYDLIKCLLETGESNYTYTDTDNRSALSIAKKLKLANIIDLLEQQYSCQSH